MKQTLLAKQYLFYLFTALFIAGVITADTTLMYGATLFFTGYVSGKKLNESMR